MPYITLENGKKIKISEESYEALAKASKEEDNEILVPDNIKIENHCGGGGDNLGIVFNKGKQTLAYNSNRGVWYVLPAYPKDFVKCMLRPVKKEDLKEGYTYFITNEKMGTDDFQEDLRDLTHYCKYLGNDEYVCIIDGSVMVSVDDGFWDYWYQVVPINEK